MKNTNDNDQLTQMGLAALLPGMRYMIEYMTKAYEEQRDRLARLQGGNGLTKYGKKLGRPLGTETSDKKKEGRGSSWGNMTKEQRSVEMKRRRQLGDANKLRKAQAAATHPRDPNHPKHQQWIDNLSKAQQASWGSLSEGQKKAKLNHMNKARKKIANQATVPTVRQALEASA